jgi:nicotinate-nucleotide adenylyltransferase
MRALPVAVVSRPWISLKSRASPAARRFAGARIPFTRAKSLADHPAPAWVFLYGPLNFQSSTALRERMRAGRMRRG